MINVTKPYLPSFDEYMKLVKGIWDRNWLTNNGPLVNELELELKQYLDINHLLFVNNGTIAIQIALKALELGKGEVITTPFSYVATTSSILWEGFKPVFVDIDELTLNIDPAKIEAAITEDTVAILATHVFGNPCDIDTIQQIADKHNLKVIYDAAHCFGTQYKGKSVFHYGDMITTSFHSTKLFHTIEGGAIFTPDANLLKTAAYMRNFGHNGPENFAGIGINGKNSEFHAAMGLLNIKQADAILASRKAVADEYDNLLQHSRLLRKPIITPNSKFNYAYYVVIFESETQLLKVVDELNKNYVFPRRYFYPSLSELSYLKETQPTPIGNSISSRVLSLPVYYGMPKEEIMMISRLILRVLNN
ncbi:DegT/DnrJ/EryC1/StrS family aminotransferase [Chitinophaga caseinilytica]|uniref:DegT/DnrJ/EryC1/StrS family aminotransferase n=1 Tax=Chitinophaga caseinilytica TaxID=2267521 RepID=A0ABZ2Z858_9BACT